LHPTASGDRRRPLSKPRKL